MYAYACMCVCVYACMRMRACVCVYLCICVPACQWWRGGKYLGNICLGELLSTKHLFAPHLDLFECAKTSETERMECVLLILM